MTIVAFVLSMPSNNSWNGKWSGEERIHAIIKSFRDGSPILGLIPDRKRSTYSFGDGWVAAVEVRHVDLAEAKRLKKASSGFCGYDWMVGFHITSRGDSRWKASVNDADHQHRGASRA